MAVARRALVLRSKGQGQGNVRGCQMHCRREWPVCMSLRLPRFSLRNMAIDLADGVAEWARQVDRDVALKIDLLQRHQQLADHGMRDFLLVFIILTAARR